MKYMVATARFVKPLLLNASSLVQASTFKIISSRRKAVSAPTYLWEGNPQTGKKILSRQFSFAGCEVAFTHRIAWYSEEGSLKWLETLHGFSWINDVIAFNDSELSAQTVRDYIADWIDNADNMHAVAHYPDVTGERVANWICFSHFFLKGSSFAFRRRYLRNLLAQVKALETAALTRPGVRGVNSRVGFAAVKGLIYASITLPFANYMLKPSIAALYYLTETTLFADGAHHSRSPFTQLEVLKTLVEIKSNLRRVASVGLARLDDAVESVASFLTYVMHGDGRLSLFNNSIMEDAGEIAEVFKYTQGGMLDSRVPAASGFHRLERAGTLVIMDAGTPSSSGNNSHYGTLSFEMSDGPERVIVNCGAYRGNDFAWRKVPRATVAHSTLTVDERNSWDAGDNIRATTMPRVTAMRGERDGNVFVDAVYNGYARYCGLIHSRQLYLTAEGDRLSGADILTSREQAHDARKHVVAIRFHTHPLIQLERYFDGAVRLTTASGSQWVFQSSHQELSQIEESIFLGNKGKPVRTSQIVLSTTLETDDLVVEWAFTRVK